MHIMNMNSNMYATREMAIQANFSGKGKAGTHLSGGDGGDEAAAANHRHGKKKKDMKHRGEEMVAMANRATHPQLMGRASDPNTLRKRSRGPARSTARMSSTSSRTVQP